MTDAFKKMSFKQKLEHIWEYYRVQIFLTIFFLIIAGSLINVLFINPAPKTYVGVAFYDNYINSDVITSLQDNYTKQFVPEEENMQIRFSSYYESESDPTVAVDMAKKFEMLLYAKELDIIVTGENKNTKENYFTGFAKQGIIAPLDKVYSDSEIDEFKKQGVLIYAKDGEGNERPFGLSPKYTTSALKDYEGFDQNSRVVCISNVTERLDKTKEVAKAIIR